MKIGGKFSLIKKFSMRNQIEGTGEEELKVVDDDMEKELKLES